MSITGEEPPEENEVYENLDEALDESDLPGHGGGPEGQRDIDGELIADRVALREVGADLDDPERISLLDGGMDDPDGSGPPPAASEGDRDNGSWDEDDGDPELQVTDVDATAMDQIPDDAPGPDSARW